MWWSLKIWQRPLAAIVVAVGPLAILYAIPLARHDWFSIWGISVGLVEVIALVIAGLVIGPAVRRLAPIPTRAERDGNRTNAALATWFHACERVAKQYARRANLDSETNARAMPGKGSK